MRARVAFGCALVLLTGSCQLEKWLGSEDYSFGPDAGMGGGKGGSRNTIAPSQPDGGGTTNTVGVSGVCDSGPCAAAAREEEACLAKATECEAYVWSSGTCSADPVDAGVECSEGVCNGDGECVPCLVNGIRDGAETDVDCGEACEELCDLGNGCASTKDCVSGGPCVLVRGSNICVSPTCKDGQKNGGEAGIDCGHICENACLQGESCEVADDCATGYCVDGVCCGTPCDGVCERCTENGACVSLEAGQGVDECMGDQYGCNGHGNCAFCEDDTKNGDETDFDCGGSICQSCEVGDACEDGVRDCLSGTCLNGTCAEPTCNDSMRNGRESDVDCGGPCGSICGNGQHCNEKADCASGNCVNEECVP